MSGGDNKLPEIEKKLFDVGNGLEKITGQVKNLEELINEYKIGLKDVVGVEEIVETPTPVDPRDSPDDSRNMNYNGSKPMVMSQLDSIRPNRKPNGAQLESIKGKINIRLDYLTKNGTPETDDEVIMLNDILKGKFRGGRRTRRMRKGLVTRRLLKNNKKTRSHKKIRSHSHKKRH